MTASTCDGENAKGGIPWSSWPTMMPSAKAFLKFCTGYFFESIRNGGDSGSGLSPVRPIAWHRLQCDLTMAWPSSTSGFAAAAGTTAERAGKTERKTSNEVLM